MELFEDEKIAAQQAIQEEAERQARLRAEKDALMAEYAEQERIRKVQLQEDLRRAAIAKRRKAESELREEAESRRIIEQNRRAAKEKWLRESFERQEWRSRQDAIQKNLESSKAETRKRQQQARRSRTLHTQSRGEVFAGWVTVQKSTLPFLKRRYCRVRKLEMILTGTDEVRNNSLVLDTKDTPDNGISLGLFPCPRTDCLGLGCESKGSRGRLRRTRSITTLLRRRLTRRGIIYSLG